MPQYAQTSPYSQDERNYANQHDLLDDHCMNIIQQLRNTRLVNSFNDNLEALTLRLDNIKLRFIIWVRSTHKLTSKSEKSVFEHLIRLNLFLLHESETIRQHGGYGMIDNSEADYEDESIPDAAKYSRLEICFRSYVDKYLDKAHKDHSATDIYNAWIVTEPVQCLNFLQILDSIVDDLFSYTVDDLAVALATGYASFATKNMTHEELRAIQKSGFSRDNLISQAATKQMYRLQNAPDTIKESQGRSGVDHPTRQVVSDESVSEMPSFPREPATEASDITSGVVERFARVLQRSRETQEIILRQDYDVSRLAQRRIVAELRKADPTSPYISIACVNDDISNLLGIIRGPPETPYEDGIFFIEIKVSKNYPLEPVDYRFLTKIYHPNIDMDGRICAKIRERDWSVSCSLWGLLASIFSLLASPNSNDPLMPAIAQQYRDDRRLYDRTVRKWTNDYAIRDWPLELEPSTPRKSVPALAVDDIGDDDDGDDDDWVLLYQSEEQESSKRSSISRGLLGLWNSGR